MSQKRDGPEDTFLIALFQVWQKRNQDTAKDFAAAIVGLVGVFVIAHWIGALIQKWTRTSSTVRTAYRRLSLLSRSLDQAISIGPITISPSKTLLLSVYIGINAALTFHDRPDLAPVLPILAKRFGWMSLCNLCLTFFLALKNTPLSPLAGYSYDNLNALHRCSGYTVIIFMILHIITYASGLAQAGHIEVFNEPHQHAGIVAAVAMLCMLITAIGPVRRRLYEFFYASHQILAAATLIATGLHRPEIALKALIIIIVAVALWFADKSLRFTRWMYRARKNYCTLVPLADGATKVTMYRDINAKPASHAFIWIPGVKLCQRHPLTLVSNNPVQFVVKARDGFSQSLHAQAIRYPGTKFRASFEGPYGQVPVLHNYDKIVLLAGGSGATFTFALAMDWARKRRTPKDHQSLDFIWTLRHGEAQQWFEQEIAELRANSRVNISLYVTSPGRGRRQEREMSYDSSIEKMSPTTSDLEKTIDIKSNSAQPSLSTRSSDTMPRMSSEYGRPNICTVVGRSMEGLVESNNVLVAACGPSGMLRDVQRAVLDVQAVAAPLIDVHCEEFSY